MGSAGCTCFHGATKHKIAIPIHASGRATLRTRRLMLGVLITEAPIFKTESLSILDRGVRAPRRSGKLAAWFGKGLPESSLRVNNARLLRHTRQTGARQPCESTKNRPDKSPVPVFSHYDRLVVPVLRFQQLHIIRQ